MSTTFVINTNLTTINCKCGGTYAIQERYRQEKQNVGGSWTCPYCETGWGYSGNSENVRLKRENEQLQNKASALACEVANQRHISDNLRKSRNAIKGVVTKIKKRVGNGVCPCCNRMFQNLHNHMKKQHPTFIEIEK